MPSLSQISKIRAFAVAREIRRKSKCWQREMMVAGILASSVVARIKTACSGGSSSVFKSAFQAPCESMCTSSMIYTRFFTCAGVYTTSLRISRTLSTPLLEAASISTTSSTLPASIPRQLAHSPHGSPSTGRSQLTAFARIFAQVVLPVPREPQKR